MPRAKIVSVEFSDIGVSEKDGVFDFTGWDKKKGEEMVKLLEKNAEDISEDFSVNIGEVVEHEDEDEDDEDDDDEEEDGGSKVPKKKEGETPEEKVARHQAKWQKKKEKYKKRAEKGKVDKIQRALDRQKAKLQKAKDKGKPEVYIAYKAGKVEFTKSLLKTAILVQNLKKAGLM